MFAQRDLTVWQTGRA